MRLRKLAFVILAGVLSVSSAFAQTPPPAGQNSSGPNKFGPRKQAAIIIFSGLGGAILGLSTLSFYGRPQEKLSNIAIGAALGIITGTIYVTYKAATQPEEFYGPQTFKSPENFYSRDLTPPALAFNYRTTF